VLSNKQQNIVNNVGLNWAMKIEVVPGLKINQSYVSRVFELSNIIRALPQFSWNGKMLCDARVTLR
jgi:hypothetical protein